MGEPPTVNRQIDPANAREVSREALVIGEPPLKACGYIPNMSRPLRNFAQFLKTASDGFKASLTDEEIAAQTQTSLRTTQRYLKSLRDAGLIEIERKRYYHPTFGWCNERFITWRL